jgi:hypothetical protein
MEYKFTLSDGVSTELLTLNPKGWEQFAVRLERDEVYHGVVKSYTFSLDFLCKDGGGYDFINTRYEANGINTNIVILVEARCGDTGGYTTLFEGKGDLASITRTSTLISLRFDQNNVQKKMMDRIDTPIPLEATETLDGSAMNSYTFAGYNLDMHSRAILLTAEMGYESGASIPVKETTNELDNVQSYGYALTHSFPVLDGSYKTLNGSVNQMDLQTGGSLPIENSVVQPFFTMTDRIAPNTDTFDVDYNFAGVFTDFVNPIAPTRSSGNVSLNLYWGSTLKDAIDNGKVQTIAVIPSYTTTLSTYNPAAPFSGVGTVSVTLNKSDNMWLVWRVGGAGYNITTGPFLGEVTWKWDYTAANISWQSTTTTEPSTAKSWAIHEACSLVCESISDQVGNAFYSELFGRTDSQPINYDEAGCGAFLALTNGLKIRQIDKPISVPLSELFQSLNAMWNIGLGFETVNGQTVARIERKNYFYDPDTVILTFDDVEGIEMTVADDLYFNEAQVGYELWESEETGGLDECNTNHVYAIPTVPRKQRYTELSPYITSSYAIELTRRNLSRTNGATIDFKYDNDKFLIELNKGSLTTPSIADEFTDITGIFKSDTVYNYEHTPARLLLRHINVLNGGLHKDSTAQITFQSGEGNITNTGEFASGCVGSYYAQGAKSSSLVENQNFLWDDDNAIDTAPLWIPEIYTFEYKLTFDQFITLQSTSKGVIRFSEDATNYKKGYIRSVDYEPNRSLATFVLLRAYEPVV